MICTYISRVGVDIIVSYSSDHFVCSVSVCFLVQAIWVLAINSDFRISISLLPDVVNLWYFKLWIMLDQIVWNIIKLQKYRYYENRVCVRNYFHAWRLSQFRSRFPVVNLVAVNVSVYLPLVVSEIAYTVNVLMSQCVRATVYIFQGCKRKGYYSLNSC